MTLSLDTPSVAAVIALYFVALAVVTGYLHVNGIAEKRATGPWFFANLLLLLSMLCYLVRLTTDVASRTSAGRHERAPAAGLRFERRGYGPPP
ncbi:MAG: hypothetical protein WCG80_06430 [Spirochaetales bacterium]